MTLAPFDLSSFSTVVSWSFTKACPSKVISLRYLFTRPMTIFSIISGGLPLVFGNALRAARCNVHGDILGEAFITAFQFHQHADLTAVDIAAEMALGRGHALEATDVDVLAEFH